MRTMTGGRPKKRKTTVRARAGVSAGGPRDSQHSRTPRPDQSGRPYARFREIVFLFSQVDSGGGTAVAMTTSFNNDIDVTYKRGSTNLSTTATRTNNLWQVGFEYQSGDKIQTPAQQSGSQTAIASATLGIDGMGGWIDPPLRVRSTVVLQCTVVNNHSAALNLCVVLGVREWYFASDAEN